MSIWNSRIGKFKKKDLNHGWLKLWLKDNWKAFWKASIYNDCCKKNNIKISCSCKRSEKDSS